MSRIKLKIPEIKSRAEMESLVGDICELKISEAKIKADMDAEIKAVRDDYESDMSGVSDRLNVNMQTAQQWAELNPSEFGKLKSIDMTHGVVGWRIGNPTLKPRSGLTWDNVVERIKQMTGFSACIRHIEEPDKQAILAKRDEFTAGEFIAMGVRVVQAETFFIEVKTTNVEKRVEVAA